MFNNIAFFGPAHVGKSTLVGYLLTQNPQNKLDDCEFERIVEKHKKRANSEYDDSRVFGYFVDSIKSEIKRVDESFSTTKQLHFFEMMFNNESIVLIDTPGFNKKHDEQYKGVFLADIGVFVIDVLKMQKLLNLKSNSEMSNRYRFEINAYFSPLFLWGQTRSYDDIIFVVSKFDQYDHSTNSDFSDFLEQSKLFIEELLDAPRIYLVHTFIDVDNRVGHNIFTPAKENQQSLCFLDTIEHIKKSRHSLSHNASHLISSTSDEPQEDDAELRDRLRLWINTSFAFIDKKFGERRSKKDGNKRHPSALRIKAVNCDFHKDTEVMFGPVQDRTTLKIESERESFFCTGKIDSIMIDGSRRESDQLSEGQIGGIVLKQVHTMDGKRMDLKDLKVKRTSIVASIGTRFRHGNLLFLKININDWTKHWLNQYDFYDLKLNHQMDIHWGGKTIYCILIGKKVIGSDCLIQVYLPYDIMCFPENHDILPDGNNISILKRYSKNKFVFENTPHGFEPVVFLKSKVVGVDMLSDMYEIRYEVLSHDAKVDISEHLRSKYKLRVSSDGSKKYCGEIATNPKKIIKDIKKLAEMYDDPSGLYDKSEISVLLNKSRG